MKILFFQRFGSAARKQKHLVVLGSTFWRLLFSSFLNNLDTSGQTEHTFRTFAGDTKPGEAGTVVNKNNNQVPSHG